MVTTYPVDVIMSRVQAGETFQKATKMKSYGSGLSWAVGKCIVSNFVALSVYKAMCKSLRAKQPMRKIKQVVKVNIVDGIQSYRGRLI